MNKQIAVALFAGAMLANHGYAQKQKPHHASRIASGKKNTGAEYGIASFYANKFNGRRTANGEIFNQAKFTAASNTILLNTWVKVTNLHNKRTVIVKITDRMHFRNKRLIDLSRAAAHKLGYLGGGLAKVKVDVIGRHKPIEAESTAGNK